MVAAAASVMAPHAVVLEAAHNLAGEVLHKVPHVVADVQKVAGQIPLGADAVVDKVGQEVPPRVVIPSKFRLKSFFAKIYTIDLVSG